MPETWPAGFPQCFELGSDSEGITDGRVSSKPDAGPPLTRRRSSAMADPLSGTMVFTSAQLADLKTFVRTTVLGGSLPFNFPAQSGGGTVLVMFEHDALPSWSRIGGNRYRVRMQLNVMP